MKILSEKSPKNSKMSNKKKANSKNLSKNNMEKIKGIIPRGTDVKITYTVNSF